jgi:hypothetical protein
MANMNNKIKQEINKIDIPIEVSERSKIGVSKAKKEMQNGQKRYTVAGIVLVASILLSIGVYGILNDSSSLNGAIEEQNTPTVTKSGGVKIPAIQLPENSSRAKMIGLIVYNGKIYTRTRTEIDAEDAKAILGEKLGITKNTIDEWSKQDAYDVEFASTIGTVDVYTVKGYEKDFRIMTYGEQDGEAYAEFFEHLNGITINIGEDLFSKLKMSGNIATAKFRTYNDWNNSVESYHPITDMNGLKNFVEELNKVKPLPRLENSDPIGNSLNNDDYRELTIQLNDGTKVKLNLLKDNYIYYGFTDAYFKMNDELFSKIWSQLQ